MSYTINRILENKNEKNTLKKLNECVILYTNYEKTGEHSPEFVSNIKKEIKTELDKDMGFVTYILMKACNLNTVTGVRYEIFSGKYICNEGDYISLDDILKDLSQIIELYKEYIKPGNPSIRNLIDLQTTGLKVLELLNGTNDLSKFPPHLIHILLELQEKLKNLGLRLDN